MNQWLIITTIGPGNSTDALFAGVVIPNLILNVTANSAKNVLIPTLSKSGENSKLTWTFFVLFGFLYSSFTVLILSTANLWVGYLFPGFDSANQALTTDLVRIQSVGMIFTGLNVVLWSSAHSKNRFIKVELVGLAANTIGLFILYKWLDTLGIYLAAVSYVLKSFVQTILLINELGKPVRPDFKSAEITNTRRLMLPLLLGSIYYKSDKLVDRILLSMAVPGSISLLHLSNQVYFAGNSILTKSITNPVIPRLSKLFQSKDLVGFKSLYKKRALMLTVIFAVAFATLLLQGKEILVYLFSYKNFSLDKISELWLIMIAFFGFGYGGIIGNLFSSAFYASGDTKTPTNIGVLGYTLGVILKIIGFYQYGIIGICLATSFYYFINSVLLNIYLNLSLKSYDGKKTESY